ASPPRYHPPSPTRRSPDLGERLPNRSSSSRTLGVAEPAGTDTVRDVVDDVVVAGVGAGLFVGDARRHVVEPEIVAHLPGDVVIGAGRVTTHTKAAHERPVSVVQRETAAEHVGAPDPLPHHEVFRGAVVARVAAIRHLVVRRVGFLEPEQRAAGLAGGVEVGGRKSEMWQAERVRGVPEVEGFARGERETEHGSILRWWVDVSRGSREWTAFVA